MDPGARDRLWAYAYGVNRGLAEAVGKGNYEFQKLGYQPDAWRPEDSVTILLLQSFSEIAGHIVAKSKRGQVGRNFRSRGPSSFPA